MSIQEKMQAIVFQTVYFGQMFFGFCFRAKGFRQMESNQFKFIFHVIHYVIQGGLRLIFKKFCGVQGRERQGEGNEKRIEPIRFYEHDSKHKCKP